jgi:Predicted membrane protein
MVEDESESSEQPEDDEESIEPDQEAPSNEETESEKQSGDEKPKADEKYCSSCGEVIKEEAEVCPECGVRQNSSSQGVDRTTAGIFAILLGSFGAHRFYLGDTGLGVIYLCFSWTGIPGLVGLIEGIIYLTKTDQEFQERYVNN